MRKNRSRRNQPSEWDETGEILRLFGDRLVELRWAKWVRTDQVGIFFELTPIGRKKLTILLSLIRVAFVAGASQASKRKTHCNKLDEGGKNG